MSLILGRYAHVAGPGVIVSTIVEAEQAHTITFTRDRRERLGYTLTVVHSTPTKARDTHDTQLETARASADQKPPAPRPKPVEGSSITTFIHPDVVAFQNALAQFTNQSLTMHRRRSWGDAR